MELNRKNWLAFSHALWRVRFINRLMDSHMLLKRRGRSWDEDLADLTERLAAAEEELAPFPPEWEQLTPGEIPIWPTS